VPRPMPTISVVIPTYHRYDALEHTVQDLSRQTVAPREIIVVDNTPVAERHKPVWFDRTGDACKVVYVSSSMEGRVNVARNEGLRIASADYVVLLDDDMDLAPNFLERFLEVHAEGWDAVAGEVIENGRALDTPALAGRPLWAVLRHRRGVDHCHTIAVPSCLVSMRRTMIESLDYLDEAFLYSFDDYDLGFRIWQKGYTLIFDRRVSARHLKLPHGGSRQTLVGAKRRLNRYTAKYHFLAKHFDKRSVRLEWLTDLTLGCWDNRRRPLQALREAMVVVRALRLAPSYANSDRERVR